MGRLIAGGKATLADLKERLDLEDAYSILEAEYVVMRNEEIAQKESMARAGAKGVNHD